MALGRQLTDAQGATHQMLGLLSLETSFAKRKLHLGYRALKPLGGPFETALFGHEYHTMPPRCLPKVRALFEARDAEGNTLPPMGLRQATVSGSFAHVIDRAG